MKNKTLLRPTMKAKSLLSVAEEVEDSDEEKRSPKKRNLPVPQFEPSKRQKILEQKLGDNLQSTSSVPPPPIPSSSPMKSNIPNKPNDFLAEFADLAGVDLDSLPNKDSKENNPTTVAQPLILDENVQVSAKIL